MSESLSESYESSFEINLNECLQNLDNQNLFLKQTTESIVQETQ